MKNTGIREVSPQVPMRMLRLNKDMPMARTGIQRQTQTTNAVDGLVPELRGPAKEETSIINEGEGQ